MTTNADDIRTITATATGRAVGVPDLMTVLVGIANEGPGAAEVLADNTRRTQELVDGLRSMGTEERDIATTSVTLGPRYDANGKVDGFRADNVLRVTLRDLDAAGRHLDAVVAAGGNNAMVHGIELGFSDDDALRSQARADAIRRARAQAEEMATAAGATVGRVRTVTDAVLATGGPTPFPAFKAMAMDASVPIQAGTREVTVQVQVVFDLA